MVDIGSLTRWRRLALLALTTAIFLAADQADQHIGRSVVLAAPLDETAHFLTTRLAIWALGGVADRERALRSCGRSRMPRPACRMRATLPGWP
ncbi:MAG: hypothetical protein ACR2GZ_09045 [Solirubrobacteraceae bacterium]